MKHRTLNSSDARPAGKSVFVNDSTDSCCTTLLTGLGSATEPE